ncbi:AbiV family abortive infection protein [Patescibacteria group bacterium]|nr:AbiV family abortive infection protein [Patescibacteria group bacterium]
MITNQKLDRMAFLAFCNAIRLHEDAIELYKIKSYSSAFFLSVLSQEEIGKMHLINDYTWQRGTSDDPKAYAKGVEKMFVEAIFLHKLKQAHFLLNSPIENNYSARGRRIMEEAWKGVLDGEKQNAVYVGFGRKNGKIDTSGPIKHPWQVTEKEAETQITKMNDYLLVFGLGLRYTNFVFENEDIEYMWKGKKFLRKISSLWKSYSRSAKKQIKTYQKLLKENIVNVS